MEHNSNITNTIYLDNNSTTFMPKSVIREMIAWMNKGNASSSYASGVECKEKILAVKKFIAGVCGISQDDYNIIFNSGASEGNAYILRCVVDSYYAKTKVKPHIITSAIEHKSILSCLKDLESLERVSITYINPDKLGFIHANNIEEKIQKNTALIVVMSANNETGAINDVKKIGTMAHKHNIPYYCDCTQSFGKIPLNPDIYNVDAFTLSFHKLHGPPGIGVLIVKKSFYDGFQIKPLIAGSQNDGLRGGTENIPAIAGAHQAMRTVYKNRKNKNDMLVKKKIFIIKELSKHIPCKSLSSYWEEKSSNPKYQNSIEVIFITGEDPLNYLCNTLLLTVVKRTSPMICNSIMKNMLEKHNVIVSIGSACNTQSKYASHVVNAMDFDIFLKKGLLRISLCDDTTYDDLKQFIVAFLMVIKACIKNTCDLPNYVDNKQLTTKK